MTRYIYNNEARYDSAKITEVRQDLAEAAEVGQLMHELVDQLQQASRSLRPGIVPGLEEQLFRIGGEIFTLKRDIEATFERMPERLENATYLGNLAARRYAEVVEE